MNAVKFEAMSDAEFLAYGKSVHADYFAAMNYVGDGRDERIAEQRRRVHAVQAEAGRRMNAWNQEGTP